MSLKEKIKAGAIRFGFVDVGFTSVFPVPGLQRYQDWKEKGQQAGKDYLARQRALEARSEPRKLLPSCRTIISLLSSYPPPGDLQTERMHEIGSDGDLRSDRVLEIGSGGDLRSDCVLGEDTGTINRGDTGTIKSKGRIAAYALQPDYHEVLKERLERLIVLIKELAGSEVETYACVDNAPILEKGYAQKAGLGWIGRNSLLLHPEFGSWTNLSELLINLELEPDPPFETDGCGNCQLCVRACPTQAIMPDRSIDARRCLSYLTIENRAEIPVELRKAVGNRVFGCDQCQSICPVNKKALLKPQTKVIEEFHDLAESFSLTGEEFRLKYRHIPVWRAKFAGFRRNVAIAMGNSGQKEFIPLLGDALENECDAVVAEAMRWAIEELAK
jgi:epoxyqueuosine reductase